MYMRDMLPTIAQNNATLLQLGSLIGDNVVLWKTDGDPKKLGFQFEEFNYNCLRVLACIIVNDQNLLFENNIIQASLRSNFLKRPAAIMASYVKAAKTEYRPDTLCGMTTFASAKTYLMTRWGTNVTGSGSLKFPAYAQNPDAHRKCVEIAGVALSNFIKLMLAIMTTPNLQYNDTEPKSQEEYLKSPPLKRFFDAFNATVVLNQRADRVRDSNAHTSVITLQTILDLVDRSPVADRVYRRIGEELFHTQTLWEELLPDERARLDQMLIEAPPKSQIYDPITPADEKQARDMAAAAETLQNIELKQRYVVYGPKEQGKDVSPVVDWNEMEVNKRLIGPVAKMYVSALLRLGKDGYVKKFTREGDHLLDMGRSALAQTLSTDQLAVAHIGQEKFENIVPLNVLKDIGLLVPILICTESVENEELAPGEEPRCTESITISSGCSKYAAPGYKDLSKHSMDEVMELFRRWGILAEIFSLVLAGKKVSTSLRQAIAKPWHHSASYRAPPASVRDDIGAWADEYGEDEDVGITEEVAPVYSVPPSTPAGFWSSLKSVFSDDPANDPASIASWGAYEEDVY
jgi:hypothetical protein